MDDRWMDDLGKMWIVRISKDTEPIQRQKENSPLNTENE
jgi:hypothetical protein